LLSVQLPGRYQVQRWGDTDWVLDVAHNPDAAAALAANLGEQYVSGKTLAILGMLANKDVSGVVAALQSRVDIWHLTGLADARGLSGSELQDRVTSGGLHVETIVHADVQEAIHRVVADAGAHDRIVVCGSFLTVGAVLEWMNAQQTNAAQTL
jgi:dihydrofolate synthase/folylpolyglutamate synthase